ncbi:MAG: hypothetical protein KGN34_01955 [Sphingomonadales bacterium]|nr:hypothetical protein [Sphingomonadales bacterium]
MNRSLHNTVRPELVEGPFFSSTPALKEVQGFDKLSPDGFGLRRGAL